MRSFKTAPFKTKDKIMMKFTTIFFRKNKTKQTKTAIHDNNKKLNTTMNSNCSFKENISGEFYKTLPQVFGNI